MRTRPPTLRSIPRISSRTDNLSRMNDPMSRSGRWAVTVAQ
jgi:hypothetical protein